MTCHLGRTLAAILLGMGLAAGWGAVAAQQPPPNSETKDDSKKKEEDLRKKKEEEAKKREEDAKRLAAAVEEQKKIAQVNWETLAFGDPVLRETPHLLIYTPKANAKRLPEAQAILERFYSLANQALGFTPADPPWRGKMTVYLFSERDQFAAFRRRVEKEKLEPEDTCSFKLGAAPHVSGSPPRSSGDVGIEGQAGEMLAEAMLAKKGEGFQIPAWLMKGFPRATYYHALPTSSTTMYERRYAYGLVKDKKGNADQVFNNSLDPDRTPALRGSLASFLAYGPGNNVFPAFVAGFKPDKEKKQQMRNTKEALKEVALEPDTVNKKWHEWVLQGR